MRETETVEKAQEEAAWVQESTVTLAESRLRAPRAEFIVGMYVPPEPHLFVPFGIDSYKPRQEHYDVELVLRDPTVHLFVSWAQVYPLICLRFQFRAVASLNLIEIN